MQLLAIGIILVTVSLSVGNERCPTREMRRHKNSCFWIDNDVLSHPLAEAKCKRNGGYLAMPKDASTQQFIKDLVHEGRYNSYWIGIREIEDTTWVYSDYSRLGDFTYWASDEPSGARDEDCVLIGHRQRTKWLTTQCHWGYRFVCQLINECDPHDLSVNNLRIVTNSGPLRHLSTRNDVRSVYGIGTSVTVECMEGYHSLTGPSQLSCEIGGKWTNSTRCEAGCPPPTLSSSVRLMRTQITYNFGHNLQLECDRGSILHGNLMCNTNGRWTGNAVCIPVPVYHHTTSTTTTTTTPRSSTISSPCPNLPSTLPNFSEVEVRVIQLGMSVHLPCVSDLQTFPHGLWMKEQAVLEFGKVEIAHVRVLSNGTLQISQMSREAEGLYTCVAFGSTGNSQVSSRSVRVVLPKECNLSFETPPSVHVLSGTDFVLLRCHATNALMSWHRNDRPITTDQHHILLSNSALIVKRSTSTAGDYICRAEHSQTHCLVDRSVTVPIDGNVEEICGRARVPAMALHNNTQHGRLIGGHVAPKGSHPWLVIFINVIDGSEKFLCGGNLINNQWVATAAHCFYWVRNNGDLRNLKAKLGKYNRIEPETHEKTLTLNRIIRHPDFDVELRSFDNDIALIQLSETVPFSDHILPICLPSEGFLARYVPNRSRFIHESSGIVSGWGRLQEEGLQPRLLHQVRLPFVDYNKCKASTTQHVTDNMFCAGNEVEVGDSCQGDSGGPFEVDKNGVVYLAGIVSWGEGCARPGKYGFYTKVENYGRFIREHLQI